MAQDMGKTPPHFLIFIGSILKSIMSWKSTIGNTYLGPILNEVVSVIVSTLFGTLFD